MVRNSPTLRPAGQEPLDGPRKQTCGPLAFELVMLSIYASDKQQREDDVYRRVAAKTTKVWDLFFTDEKFKQVKRMKIFNNFQAQG